MVVVVLNAATSATSVTYAMQNTAMITGTATPYLTNTSNSMTAQAPIAVNGGAFSATVPARSMVTYRIAAGSTQPTTSAPPSSTPPTTPPGGNCTATLTAGSTWTDRYNLAITVTGTDNWIVTMTMSGPARVLTTWNTNATWSSAGTIMTATPNGNGNNWGLTIKHNGNQTWPTASCRPA